MDRRGLLVGAAFGAIAAAPAIAAENPPPFYSRGGQFTLLRPPPRAPIRAIRTAADSLVDFRALAGRIILVNFWATWCAACATELPSLDRLAARLHDQSGVVLPIALDARAPAEVAAFYAAHGVTHLPLLTDPDRRLGHLGQAGDWHDLFPLTALPTTYLIDRRGDVLGYVPGAAEWDSVPAQDLIAWLAAR